MKKSDNILRRAVTVTLVVTGFVIIGCLLGAAAAKASKMYMEVGR